MQPWKFGGKELDTTKELHRSDLGIRHYDPILGRWHSIDPKAEKYYSLTPYNYCAGNAINSFDLKGDSIWYTIDKNVVTMHVTAKIINQSSENINMNRAAGDIAAGIDQAFGGTFEIQGNTYSLQTDIQLEVAESMKEVDSSDHLFVLAGSDGKGARGATNIMGGKVMTLASSDYRNDNWFSNTFLRNDTRSAVHEFGHAAGLRHESASGWLNLMKQQGIGTKVSSGQRIEMLRQRNFINVGPNSYGFMPFLFIFNSQTRKWVHLKTVGLYK